MSNTLGLGKTDPCKWMYNIVVGVDLKTISLSGLHLCLHPEIDTNTDVDMSSTYMDGSGDIFMLPLQVIYSMVT